MLKLGKHFLTDKKILKQIAASLDLRDGDIVVEIGAGHGELTDVIHETCSMKHETKIIAIEKDKNLSLLLKRKYANNEKIHVIAGDVLKILPQIVKRHALTAKRFKVTGNIPYYITGKLSRLLGELITNNQLPITSIVLTIQKEVAERLTAKPPKMNLLAASVQIWAEPKIIATVPPNAFNPPPKVNSAIIKLTTCDLQLTTEELKNYYKFIKTLFKQPRKTILNNLSKNSKKNKEETAELLKKEGANPQDRPQDLKLEDLIALSRRFIHR